MNAKIFDLRVDAQKRRVTEALLSILISKHPRDFREPCEHQTGGDKTTIAELLRAVNAFIVSDGIKRILMACDN